MKKTTKDNEIEKLKEQVEKQKSEKESLKRDKKVSQWKVGYFSSKADKYHDALKKKQHRKVGVKDTISMSLACLPDSNNLQVNILVDITHAVVFCLGLSNRLLVN